MAASSFESCKTKCVAALACAAAYHGLYACYLWRLNRRLPQGIRYQTDGPLCSNGHYEVTDLSILKRNARVLIHPTAGARVYMGGMREENILCSPAGLWERQRAIIHPFIGTHAGQYLSLLQNTELVFSEENGDVDLLEEVGKYVAHISTTPMGLTIEGGFSWANVNRAVLGVSATLALGFSERLLKCVIRMMLPFTNLEQQIAKFVDESNCSLVRDLVAEFGKHETGGHIWGVINGSIIPETNMICSIMHEIATDPALQATLHDMICEDTTETIVHNAAFEECIAKQCREHAFFRSTSRIAQDNFVVDGYTIPKGANLRIPIAKLNELPGASLTWGFGKRTCPGAKIGKNIIKLTVFRILRSYHLELKQDPFNLKTDTVNMYPFGLRVTCRKRAEGKM